jgi:RecA-family ATPase
VKSIAQAVIGAEPVGAELPMPWPALNEVVTVRTGELIVVAGGPGGGKSTLAVNIAQQVEYPVLYIAQDQPASVLSRIVALELGHKTASVAARLNDPEQRGKVQAGLRVRDTLILETGSVTSERVESCALALKEWLGQAPPLIIIDNLIDMTVEGHNFHEAGFYAEVLPQLKQISQRLPAAIMVLHHVTRSGDGKKHGLGNQPMKMSDLLYAGERTARHVWGCYTQDDTEMRVQILKNQEGPADPSGDMFIGLRWVPAYTKLVGRAL